MSDEESPNDDKETFVDGEKEKSDSHESRPAFPKFVKRDNDLDFSHKKGSMGRMSGDNPMFLMSDGLNDSITRDDGSNSSRSELRKRDEKYNPRSRSHRQPDTTSPTISIIPQPETWFKRAMHYAKVALFAIFCVFVYHLYSTQGGGLLPLSLSMFSKKNDTEHVFVPLKLINYMPAAKCYPVSQEEFTFYKTDKEWDHVLRSMFYYMTVEEFDSISAFHVGHASCFMMIRQEDNSILQMFNPNFKGYHDTVYVRVNEISVACPQITRVVERANTVIMTYNEHERGELVIEKFNNSQAWTVQATGFYLKGKTTCDTGKANTDYGRITLKEEVE